jgi:GrpB-like predicted nucleotidyltransferase (UPF0157 family)
MRIGINIVGPHDMIGLRRHTVQVVEHRSEWAGLFGAEAETLRERIGDIVADIQHVGSTAVPGLPAKPILDIAVAVRSGDAIPLVVRRLVEAGYIDRGDAGREGGYLLVKDSEPDVRIVHLHIVEQADIQWRNYTVFRDTLCGDSSIQERYANLKRCLAEQFRDDRKSYTEGKNRFIQEVLNSNREAQQADA